MSKKRKILTAVAVVLALLVVAFLFTKSRWNHGDQDGIMGIYPTPIK